jgi:hypothetical protein
VGLFNKQQARSVGQERARKQRAGKEGKVAKTGYTACFLTVSQQKYLIQALK